MLLQFSFTIQNCLIRSVSILLVQYLWFYYSGLHDKQELDFRIQQSLLIIFIIII